MELVSGYHVGSECLKVGHKNRLMMLEEFGWEARRLKPETESKIRHLAVSASGAYQEGKMPAFTAHIMDIGLIVMREKVVFPPVYEPFDELNFFGMLFEAFSSCVTDIVSDREKLNGELLQNCLKCMRALSVTPEFNERITGEVLDGIIALFPFVEEIPRSALLGLLSNATTLPLSDVQSSRILEFACQFINASEDVRLFVLCLLCISNLIKDKPVEEPIAVGILQACYKAVQGIVSKAKEKVYCNRLVCDVLFQLTKTGSIPLETFFGMGFQKCVRLNMFKYKEECFMIIGWFAMRHPETLPRFEIDWTMLSVDLQPRDERQLHEDKAYRQSCAILCWTLTQYLNALPECANEDTTPLIIRLIGLYWDDADFWFKKHLTLLFLAIIFHRSDSLLPPDSIREALSVLHFASELGYDEELSPCLADTLIKLHRVATALGMDTDPISTAALELVEELRQNTPDSPKIAALTSVFAE